MCYQRGITACWRRYFPRPGRGSAYRQWLGWKCWDSFNYWWWRRLRLNQSKHIYLSRANFLMVFKEHQAMRKYMTCYCTWSISYWKSCGNSKFSDRLIFGQNFCPKLDLSEVCWCWCKCHMYANTKYFQPCS